MRITRSRASLAGIASLVGMALVATVATVSAQTAGAAEAMAPGASISSPGRLGAVSWQTPAVPSRHARIANTAAADGAASVITLADSSAPTSYRFALALPAGATTALRADGSVTVSVAGAPVGSFLPPWAKDASGKGLPTSYTLDGKVLTQHIDTKGAQYPVTADPKFTWGIISGTLYLNKSETQKVALGGSIVSWIPNPAAIIGGRALFAWAAYAVATKRCIKFKVHAWSAINLSAQPGYYTGGYCK